ncbi:coiled-coil domain-containing protein 3 precursor [Silurus meridionalis]|nr:coiled-coil domain-containing protein 3 precursor [Silurus meridionalis]
MLCDQAWGSMLEVPTGSRLNVTGLGYLSCQSHAVMENYSYIFFLRMDENYNLLPHGVNYQDAIFPDTQENRRMFSSLFQFSNCSSIHTFHSFSPDWEHQEDHRGVLSFNAMQMMQRASGDHEYPAPLAICAGSPQRRQNGDLKAGSSSSGKKAKTAVAESGQQGGCGSCDKNMTTRSVFAYSDQLSSLGSRRVMSKIIGTLRENGDKDEGIKSKQCPKIFSNLLCSSVQQVLFEEEERAGRLQERVTELEKKNQKLKERVGKLKRSLLKERKTSSRYERELQELQQRQSAIKKTSEHHLNSIAPPHRLSRHKYTHTL